jgi:hypothetical protein
MVGAGQAAAKYREYQQISGSTVTETGRRND